MLPTRVPPIYSRAERLSDAAVHVTGIALGLIGVPVLVTLAAIRVWDAGTLTAVVVYGLTLICMLICSAIYQMSQASGRRDFLRRLDQSAIYLKIAGTYTPFAVLTGTSAGVFLAGIWSAALAGAAMILFGSDRLRRPSLVLYLVIGWAGVVAARPVFDAIDPASFRLVLAGGCLYTLGVVFFLWERLPFHNTIWHVFVLAATALIYAAVVVEIGRGPMLASASPAAATSAAEAVTF